jgi:lauroyl/myristoyl acyltransferase
MTVTEQPPVRTASRRDRVYGSYRFHRAYPMMLGARYARYRTDRWWATDPRARDDARLQMRFLVGREPGADLDALAKDYMYETFKREELGWRPWLTSRFAVDGEQWLRDAQAAGNGAILNFAHHGHYGGIFASLGRLGFRTHVATDSWFLYQQRSDYVGMVGRRHLALISSNGSQPFDVAGSYPHMRDLLEAGETVGIASDLPGNTQASFLGRPVKVASGAARLALDTGAPIVIVTTRRHRWGQRVTVEEPIRPEDFTDFRVLLGEILRRHEPAVRAWPAAFERPLRHFAPVEAADIDAFGFDQAEYFKRFRL